MLDNRVCAIVVTFHPTSVELANLAKLRPQVSALVIVDNGSSEEKLVALRAAIQSLGAVLIENGTNLGIAAALNTGIKWAIAHQQQWVALFDQDSTVVEGFVEFMLDDLANFPAESKVMQMIPRYRDPVSGAEEKVAVGHDGAPFLVRTSGSFFPISTFERCGLFAEELFIYCVDDDYSLRLRSLGYSIAQSKRAFLLHHAGKPTTVSILGKTYTTRNYRPEVQYYWARNRVWLIRKHGKHFPFLIFSSVRSLVAVPLKIAIGETRPWTKIRMFLKGIFHGLLGKTGKQVAIT
jgi:rhamnosyltransferase